MSDGQSGEPVDRDTATWGLIDAWDDEADTEGDLIVALAPWVQQLTEIMTAAGRPADEPGDTDPPKVGVASILIRDGRILVGRRRGAHGDGMWSVPGGHPYFGESWADTAAREAKEETGLDMLDPQFVAVTNDLEPGLGTHYVTLWIAGDCPTGEPRLTEPDRFTDHRWVKLDELPEPLFWPWHNLLTSFFMPGLRALVGGRSAAPTREPKTWGDVEPCFVCPACLNGVRSQCERVSLELRP